MSCRHKELWYNKGSKGGKAFQNNKNIMRITVKANKIGHTSVKKDTIDTDGKDRSSNLFWVADYHAHKKKSGVNVGDVALSAEAEELLTKFLKFKSCADKVTITNRVLSEGEIDLSRVVSGLTAVDITEFILYVADGDRVNLRLSQAQNELTALERSDLTKNLKILSEVTNQVAFRGNAWTR